MTRLFVALELAPETIDLLHRLRPSPSLAVRFPAADDTHLTLHYLGEREAERTSTSLARLAAPALSLILEGVGRFTSPIGAVTLCAGNRPTPELFGLHRAVAAVLAPDGFTPEARPYTPHVTLARYEPGAPPGAVDSFLARHGGFSARSSAGRGGSPL